MPAERLIAAESPSLAARGSVAGIRITAILIMTAVAPMAAVAEHVEEGAGEQEEKWQGTEEMSAVFGEEEESSDRDEAGERPPGSGSSADVTHGEPL